MRLRPGFPRHGGYARTREEAETPGVGRHPPPAGGSVHGGHEGGPREPRGLGTSPPDALPGPLPKPRGGAPGPRDRGASIDVRNRFARGRRGPSRDAGRSPRRSADGGARPAAGPPRGSGLRRGLLLLEQRRHRRRGARRPGPAGGPPGAPPPTPPRDPRPPLRDPMQRPDL